MYQLILASMYMFAIIIIIIVIYFTGNSFSSRVDICTIVQDFRLAR